MVECSFREVGCLATVHPEELAAHLDTQIHYHTSVSIASKFHTISVFPTAFGGIVMIYLDTFHMPGCNGSLLITIQPKAKYTLLHFVDTLKKLHMFWNGDRHIYIFRILD
jgi:hypothetical protein